MPDQRQLARDILAGKITVEQAARMRRSTPAPAAPASAPATPPPVAPPPPPRASDVPPLPGDAAAAISAEVENKAPVVTNAPAAGRKFPCKQCGARLDFDPSQRALQCPYCGHLEEIAPSKSAVVERDYTQALAKVATDQGAIPGRSSEVRCPGCGAQVLIEDNVETQRCPFCTTHLENAPRAAATAMILPECVLPFKFTSRQAIDAFNAWIRSRWFAPNNLRQMANLGQLSGIYLPFWTYDSMTYTHYTGQRGDDYWETQHYTDSQGKRQTRQVRKTRWRYVSGEVDHFFDDVLVCASRSVPVKYVTALDPWDLGGLESFRPEFLSGFKTERYVVNLEEGFTTARQIMDGEIRTLCCRDIGGDHQRLSSVQTQHVGVTFKHILLPVWLAVYRYGPRTFRILVNVRTGEVQGDRPYSWIKITLAVIAALIVIATIILIIQANKGRGSVQNSEFRIQSGGVLYSGL